MSTVQLSKTAIVVCGMSAAVACVGYYVWMKRRKNRRKSPSKTGTKSTSKKRQLSPKLSPKKSSISDEEENVSSASSNEDVQLKYRGNSKKVYQNGLSKQADSNDPASIDIDRVSPTNIVTKSNETAASWNQESDRTDSGSGASSETEMVSSRSMVNGNSKTGVGNFKNQSSNIRSSIGSIDNEICNVPIQGLRQQLAQSPAVSSMKSQCADSPSLGSDLQSEASQDSGKGTSASTAGLQSSMSPVEELIEVPPVYEFEVPKDIVGLLIGKNGITIKWLTQQSQAYIVIRDHFYSDKHKICTLEGTREQINKCLRLIRRKFPPSRFPELKLTPVLPPPVSTTPKTPVYDHVVQLNLPEGVNCEVAVSSVVNVGHVFIQQPTHPTFPSLSRLDQYMVAVYSQAGVPPLPRPIEMGVVCAAPVLGGWYRAQTIDVYEDTDEALVKFVDYGGYCRVSTSDLRQIRSDFMTLPFQATECYLANIAPVDEVEGWSPDALSLLEQMSMGKVIEARVTGHSSDRTPLIELYAPGQNSDSKPILINRLLVDRGFASWTDS